MIFTTSEECLKEKKRKRERKQNTRRIFINFITIIFTVAFSGNPFFCADETN